MDSSEDEDEIQLFGWGRNKKSRAAKERLEMGERYLSNRKGRSVVQSQACVSNQYWDVVVSCP